MAIPDFQTLMLPVIRFAADGSEFPTSAAASSIAAEFRLTEAETQQFLESGQLVLRNRVAWAVAYLKKAGLLEKVRRGTYRITPRGLSVLSTNPSRVDMKFLEQFPEYLAFRNLRHTTSMGASEPESVHGISHARGKQFLYNEGTHIPFIVRGPGIESGQLRKDLIEHIDMAAISLAAAGIPVPAPMHGRDVFAKDYLPRTEVFAARDRCDETVERLRSVRTDRFLYIRNFYPLRPHLQPNAYKDGKSIVQTLRLLHEKSQLDPLAESLLFSPTRPPEELYEWKTDPWQVKNLAADAEHRSTLEQLRARLDQWMIDSHDRGAESDAMYDSDMVAYLSKGNPVVERNIAIMKQWAKAEKVGPNNSREK